MNFGFDGMVDGERRGASVCGFRHASRIARILIPAIFAARAGLRGKRKPGRHGPIKLIVPWPAGGGGRIQDREA
jgi:hypothetical protein